MTLMLFVADGFRSGLDADTPVSLHTMSAHVIAVGVAQIGGTGLVFVVAGRWLANRSVRPRRLFLILVPAMPAAMILASKIFGGLFYLPSWIEIGFTTIAFLAAAITYLAVAQAATRAP